MGNVSVCVCVCLVCVYVCACMYMCACTCTCMLRINTLQAGTTLSLNKTKCQVWSSPGNKGTSSYLHLSAKWSLPWTGGAVGPVALAAPEAKRQKCTLDFCCQFYGQLDPCFHHFYGQLDPHCHHFYGQLDLGCHHFYGCRPAVSKPSSKWTQQETSSRLSQSTLKNFFFFLKFCNNKATENLSI